MPLAFEIKLDEPNSNSLVTDFSVTRRLSRLIYHRKWRFLALGNENREGSKFITGLNAMQEEEKLHSEDEFVTRCHRIG